MKYIYISGYFVAFLFGILTSRFFLDSAPTSNVLVNSSMVKQPLSHTISVAHDESEFDVKLDSSNANNMSNGQAAYKLAKNSPSDELSQAELTVVVANWANEDPLAAFLFGLDTNNLSLASMVMKIAGEKQSIGLFNWLIAEEQHSHFIYFSQAYFQGYSQVDPQQGLELSQQFLDINNQLMNQTTILQAWSKIDATAVLDWLNSDSSLVNNQQIYVSVMEQYIIQAPQIAIIKLNELPSTQQKKQLVPVLADALSKLDIQQGLDWAESLNPELSQEALSIVLLNWVKTGDVYGPLDYMLADDNLNAHIVSFKPAIMTLAEQSPTLIFNYLTRLPEALQIDIVQQMAENQVSSSLDNFDSWLARLPSQALADAAVKQGISSSQFSEPYRSLELAENLSSEQDRIDQQIKIFRLWSKRNFVEAKAAIFYAKNINAEQKSKLLAIIEEES